MKKFKSMMQVLCAGLLLSGSMACEDTDAQPQDDRGAVCGQGDFHEVEGATYCVYSQAIIETGFDCPRSAPNRLQYGDFTVCGSSGMLGDGIRDELHEQYEDMMLPPREASVCQGDAGCGVGSSCSRGVCEAVITAECTTDADCGVGSQCVNNVCESSSPACTMDSECAVGQICDAQSFVCVAAPVEICCNGLDDDGDGFTDSNDLEDCIQEVCQPVSCQQDADCGASEECFNGQCTAPFDEVCDDTIDNDLDGQVDCADSDCAGAPQCQGGVSCLDDAQCAPGQLCDVGQCVAVTACASDVDCGIGSTCVDSVCRSNSPACSSDAECSTGQECDAGQCVLSTSCTSDAECAVGEICDAGECVSSECTSDAECAQGELCSDGMCVVPVGLPEDCSDAIDNDGDGAVDCSDVDCFGDAVCQSVSCMDSGDCSAGQECDASSQTCISVTCATDAECSVDSICVDGMCQGNSPSCMEDVDCAAGQVCNGGQCVTIACASDNECAVGQSCVDGACQ